MNEARRPLFPRGPRRLLVNPRSGQFGLICEQQQQYSPTRCATTTIDRRKERYGPPRKVPDGWCWRSVGPVGHPLRCQAVPVAYPGSAGDLCPRTVRAPPQNKVWIEGLSRTAFFSHRCVRAVCQLAGSRCCCAHLYCRTVAECNVCTTPATFLTPPGFGHQSIAEFSRRLLLFVVHVAFVGRTIVAQGGEHSFHFTANWCARRRSKTAHAAIPMHPSAYQPRHTAGCVYM